MESVLMFDDIQRIVQYDTRIELILLLEMQTQVTLVHILHVDILLQVLAILVVYAYL